MSVIDLRTLGTVELRRTDGAASRTAPVQPRSLALLAYLALARPRGLQRRDTLVALFWPELDESRARNALSQAIHRLRVVLGEGSIVGRGQEEIGVDFDLLRSDVIAFEQALEAGEPARALELYKGEFLRGFHVGDAPGFEHWLDGERARLRHRARAVAEALAEGAEGAGHVAEAASWLRRAIAIAPDEEAALRRLIRVLDGAGESAAAAREYEAFARRLREDYDLEPAPETRALIDEVRRADRRIDVSGAEAAPAAEEWGFALARAPSQRARSIAVLPFRNMSPDPENEYFSDGMTEEIINALSKVQELRVAARTSAFAFKGRGYDVREIGHRLNVATVLEGSVRREGKRLRITSQLIDVESGYHLWSEQYDREMEDVFAIQDEISRAIVATLAMRLGLSGAGTLAKRQTESLEAYHLYLKGRHLWNRRSADLFPARECFTRAVATDPRYAAAYSALADTHALLGLYKYAAPRETFPAAKAAALEALRLDDGLAEAHTSLAFVLMLYDWAWDSAEREFQRAMELNPGYATAHHWYAECLMARGRLDAAIAHAKRALELDPLGLVIHVLLGVAYYFARRYEEAVAEYLKTVDMEPTFTAVFPWLGLALLKLERYDEAVRGFRQQLELSPDGPTTNEAVLAMAFAHAGDGTEARRLLGQLRKRATAEYVSAFDIAAIHFALREDDEALTWLEHALEERSPWLVWLAVDPYWDRIRGTGRFRALLAKLALVSEGYAPAPPPA